MSKYTTELRYIFESGKDIGLKNYPIFDESYRMNLNQKIIEHYAFREIGLETAELFIKFLNRKMNEIMPYYNQLYKSEQLIFNPMYTKNITEKYKQNQSSKSESENSSESLGESSAINNSKNIGSDTPQGLLSMSDIANNIYASTAALQNVKDEANAKNTSAATAKTDNTINDEFTRDYIGFEGISGSALLTEYRATFLNIDMLVIDELSELFLNLY